MQTITQFFNNVAGSASRALWERYVKEYGIPYANFLAAYRIDPDILRSFNGKGRWLVGDGGHYLDLGIVYGNVSKFTYKGSVVNERAAIIGSTNSTGLLQYTDPAWWNYLNAGYAKVCSLTATDDTTIEFGKTSIVIYGTTYSNTKDYSAITANALLGYGNMYNKFTNKVRSLVCEMANGNSHYYIPIKLTNGTCTMIDLMDNTQTPLEVKGDTGDGFTIEQ